MSGDLDVALRLKLLYQGRGAKAAKRDLEELRREAGKRAGAGGMAPEIEKAARAAASAKREISAITPAARRAAAEVRGVGEAASSARPKLDALGKTQIAPRARRAAADLRDVGEAAAAAKPKLEALGRTRITPQARRAAAEVRGVGAAAGDAKRKLDALGASQGLDVIPRKARRAADELKRVRDRVRELGDVEAPTSRLSGAMGGLEGVALRAFGAVAAFASVQQIISGLDQLEKKFRSTDRALASVAVTAEMRNPKVIEDLRRRNDTFGVRYGLDAADVGKGRQSFAAAGFDIPRQDAVLDPTIKAAKAGDSSAETMSRAVIALVQNLKLSEAQIPAALDMMAKGAKLGSFETDNMAKSFPSLGAGYQSLGREGLPAVSELVALAQIVRQGSGTSDEAATNLQNLIQKATAPDTIKNFKEKGVDLEAVSKRASKNGTSYLLAMVDEAMRVSKGDPFAIGELFGDMQAKQALRPLLDRRAEFESFLKQIRDDSAGTVDKDWSFLRDRPAERAARRDAAIETGAAAIGAKSTSVTEPFREALALALDRDGSYQREKYRAANPGRIEFWDEGGRQTMFEGQQAARDDKGMAELRRFEGSGDLKETLDDLRVQRAARKTRELEPRPSDVPPVESSGFADRIGSYLRTLFSATPPAPSVTPAAAPAPATSPEATSGTPLRPAAAPVAAPAQPPAAEPVVGPQIKTEIPLAPPQEPARVAPPPPRSIEQRAIDVAPRQMPPAEGPQTKIELKPTVPAGTKEEIAAALKPDLSAAATEAMTAYNGKLQAEGQKAIVLGEQIANELKARLSFTATPTINPRFGGPATLPAGVSPAAAPAAPTPGAASAPAPAAPGKQSSLGQGTKVASAGGDLYITQHIHGVSDPKAAGRESQRQLNRSVRSARARALHDLGSATA